MLLFRFYTFIHVKINKFFISKQKNKYIGIGNISAYIPQKSDFTP